MDEAGGVHRSALFGAGLLLLVAVAALTLIVPARGRGAR
jgi:hypothetical protein